jgi:hypothetical protein
VDDSPDSVAALRWVASQLWRPGDTLALMHVVPVLPATASYTLAPDGLLYTLPLPPISEAQVGEGCPWQDIVVRPQQTALAGCNAHNTTQVQHG